MAAAWPVAVLAVRRGGRLGRVVEGACWAGHSLPGVVVALSLVFFGARVVPSIYQTHWLLTLAYVVLFLPQALGAIRASLLQISPSLEEASRLLGPGPGPPPCERGAAAGSVRACWLAGRWCSSPA